MCVAGSSPPEVTDIGLAEFVFAIVRQTLTDEFGLWDIVPEPAARRFVVLLGSKDGSPEPDAFERVRLTSVDTTTMPWTKMDYFPIGDPANEPAEPQ